ncbi:MAG TPA: redoxin domain-containing protein [Chloroflexota bacterium]
MSGWLLVARLALALVFVIAAMTKLADRPAFQSSVVDFGAPRALSLPLSFLIPVAELVVAVALFFSQTAWAGSIGALVLLAIFILAISVNLAMGRTPNCNCFGQVASSPISWLTVARNAVFAAVGLFIAVGGSKDAGMNVGDWLTGLTTADRVILTAGIVGAILLVGQWGFLFSLLQQNGRLLQRLEELESRVASGSATESAAAAAPAAPPAPQYGLPVGSEAPSFALSGLYGETMTLGALLSRGKQVLLVFADPGCGPCQLVMPDIGRWQGEFAGDVTLAMISRGSADENRKKAREHGIQTVLLQESNEVDQAYQVPGTPAAVLIGADGRIATPVSAGPDGIRALVKTMGATPVAAALAGPPIPLLDEAPVPVPSANGAGQGSALTVGDAVPSIKLKDVNSKTWDLYELSGQRTLLLFWNTGCGFCQQMLSDLKEWERSKPQDAPGLVLVSAGSVEDNRAMGLKSPVLLDATFQTGQQFGASGTPMAVMIDEEGRVASGVAAGAPQVFALAAGSEDALGTGSGTAPAAARVGDPAPDVVLEDLSGSRVRVGDLRGSEVVLLFWNTGCGFCQQLLPELKEWEKQRPQTAPEIVLVSAGSAADNRAMDLQSTVLLDPNFQTGSAVGANGTPMAVLLDATGKIASDVAIGGPAVMELAKKGVGAASAA